MMVRRSKQRFKRSAGTNYGPVGAIRLLVAPWRRSAIASDIEAIDRGEGRMMLCWFRGLYGDYPRTFRSYFMNLSPDGLVLRKYVLFRERRRIPVTEELVSARERMPESLQEAFTIGANGQYAAGQPLQEWGRSIISCVTPLGVVEFAVARADAPVLLHYIDRLRLQHQDSPRPTTA
jgi:hypothetical protein